MKAKWLGMVLICALATGVLLAKQLRDPQTASHAGSTAASAAATAQAQVLLFADPSEAESSCGCGEVFRAVRAASARGVSVRELDPAQNRDVMRQYRVLVEPTVLVLDQQGREIRRHEGESSDVVAAIRTDLDRLSGTMR
jgi:hypothetical protein